MEARATDRLREAWELHNPQYPFEYHSLGAELDNMYIEEQRKEILYGTFTALAILISCLGLFGLAAFTIKKRKREIAIRKVVGASMSNLVLNLSTGFVWLGILANVVIWPVTWYLMNNWLENFTYRVNIKIIFFVYALIISLVIIMLTLTYHLIKAARDNPVDAIRYE
jgi:putative ABC transport system permease protein